MFRKLLLILIVSFFASRPGWGQSCTTLGQTPPTAFPVCGTTVFTQNNVPICSTNNLFVPGCSGASGAPDYENKNPFWYKFTCYQSGTLSFLISPMNQNDDYDWQLYDITGLPADAVFTNRNIIVAGNWAGTYGNTGASANGVNGIECASIPSDNRPTFARSPNLTVGHEYILLVSHYTDSQSGYTLSFGGGTAVITDPKLPKLVSATAPCDGQKIIVVMNKKMKCKSIAANGSDFRINIAGTNVIGELAAQCTNSFDFDTLEVTLNNPLPPGTHKLYVQRGTDGNTILDNCDREIPVGDSVEFTVYPLFPTPMDSVTKVGCAPQRLEIVYKKRMKCNSIAPNGSDFIITGPVPVTITAASGDNCVNGLSQKIYIDLAAPLQVGGTYRITLRNGSDGNTILDECDMASPAGRFVNLQVKDTVNADFNYPITFGCTKNSINYSHNGNNGVNSWQWTFDNRDFSEVQNPVIDYYTFTPKTTRLIVSNAVCSDTSDVNLVFDNYTEAAFEITTLVCPGDLAVVKNNTVTNNPIVNWLWVFDNSSTNQQQNPPPQNFTNDFLNTVVEKPVQLITTNSYGCKDTAIQYIKVANNCFIAVPSAFTPNRDGLNDYLYPLNAYKASNLHFSVFNRFGQRIFYTTNREQKWDGRFKGQDADAGTYVWMLDYIHTDTGRKVQQKGTVILIR